MPHASVIIQMTEEDADHKTSAHRDQEVRAVFQAIDHHNDKDNNHRSKPGKEM